ncbi:putative ribonuclease H-like domain-containing protein [Tanacetum coccineum]|uniref:Ribonuclease H-like domain-containing protein n=1 Tax=Tanacetum coccineum TaxID=301880 RepID=A0ABQ5F518_9ASTR
MFNPDLLHLILPEFEYGKLRPKHLFCIILQLHYIRSKVLQAQALIHLLIPSLDRFFTCKAEAVNTACYVQNRVLVVKPHNKTPYELFKGRTPTLSFMRPFGCHVTILNTLDYLGKFDGKSDEGFFVGYSLNSDGPTWMFDIDVLTKSMNYVPVVAGTNSNDFVDGLLFDSSSKNASNDEPQPSSDAGKKVDECVSKESKQSNGSQTEPNMFSLRDNAILEATHADFFGDETEVDMSNITTTYLVPSTLNTRIRKDHSLDHVIGDMQSGVQTRRMTKTTNEQGFISAVYEGKTHEDLYTSMQEELLQFKLQKVLVLVDLPKGLKKRGKIDQTLFIKKQKRDILLVQVYVDDIIFGSTKKELCTEFEKLMHDKFQMSSMRELTLFLGLQVKTASTSMDTEKPLLKDSDGDDVDVHLYRSMIGSLMYLTSSRPDIMYLKGQPKLGLWYPKDSSFDLVEYSDSDYAGASLYRKSTTGAASFCDKYLDSESNARIIDLLTKALDVGRFQYLVASIGMLNP